MKHTNLKIIATVAGLLLVACTPIDSSSSNSSSTSDEANSSSNNEANLLQNVSDLISVDLAEDHIEYLAGPEVGGRASGSADNQLACQYVADQFESYGLKPYSTETGYFQPYLQPYTRIFTDFFSFAVSNAANTSTVNYRYSYDFTFFIGNFSAFGYVFSGSSFNGQAELVPFSDVNYDYADKIVLVNNITSAILTDLYNDGAQGAIINDSGETYPVTEYGQGEYLEDSDFLMLYANPSSFTALNSNVSNGLKNADVSYTVDTVAKSVNNVIGILDVGATSSIIVSSHIDHLGRFDALADGYYAGALDNASGVAAMLELARVYRQNADRLTKNVIFISYNGEEAGLYGSEYYSKNLVGTKTATRASFNLDMLGGGSNDYELEIIGNMGGLGTSLANKLEEYGISNYVIAGNQANSDHYWLGAMRIPSLSFVHFDDRYYHRPTDTEDKINYEIFANQLSMIANFMLVNYNK